MVIPLGEYREYGRHRDRDSGGLESVSGGGLEGARPRTVEVPLPAGGALGLLPTPPTSVRVLDQHRSHAVGPRHRALAEAADQAPRRKAWDVCSSERLRPGPAAGTPGCAVGAPQGP